jgi:hypothetical protein
MLVQPTSVVPGSAPGHNSCTSEVPAARVELVDRRDVLATRRAAVKGTNCRRTRRVQTNTVTRTVNASRTNPTSSDYLKLSQGVLAVAINAANPAVTADNATVEQIESLIQQGIDRLGLNLICYTDQQSRRMALEALGEPDPARAADIMRVRERLWGTSRREMAAVGLAYHYRVGRQVAGTGQVDGNGRFINPPSRSGL